MSIPYRHQRTLKRIGTLLAILSVVFVITWLCWVVWLQRYVVYTDKGAELNFALSSYELSGKEAVEPKAQQNISIFYNEGADAIDTTHEMTQLVGYYITSDMFQQDIDYVMLQVERFAAGTPVMIDMKGGFGSFFYQSNLPDAVISASTNIEKVSQLITRLHTKGFYTIARISAFRDYNYGLNHVNIGLPFVGKQYLWADEGGCYWLNPTSQTTLSWISSIVLELRNLGFHEVMLADFRFPASEKYTFNGDKDAALLNAATSLLDSCSNYDFVLSFCVDNASFSLPDSRSRLYLEGVSAANVGVKVAQATITNPEVRLVFLAQTNDTRYNDYGVLRPVGNLG